MGTPYRPGGPVAPPGAWGRSTRGPYYPAPPVEARTVPGLLTPVPPRRRWWQVRSWRDAAWACWAVAGIATTVLVVSVTIITAGAAVAFLQYLAGLL